jgi:hypothetical protein
VIEPTIASCSSLALAPVKSALASRLILAKKKSAPDSSQQ